MPILVSYDDSLFEIRQKIAEKAKIDFFWICIQITSWI